MSSIEKDKGSLSRMLLGNAYILIATIFWGINYAFTKALIPDWMTAEGVSATRLIGGCALFWLASIFVKKEKIGREDRSRVFFGGLVLFGCIYFFVVALKYGSAIDISIISTLPPAFVILLEVLFQHRRPGWLVYAGIVISFIGAALVIISSPHGSASGDNPLLGDMFAVLASISFALYLFVLSKPSLEYNPIILLRWVFLFAALPALFIVPGMQDMAILHARQAAPWLEIAFIVLGPTFLAYLLTQPAERDIGSVLVSLYQYLTPVVAAISSVLMGMDKLRWMQVIAMIIIIGGMALTNIGKKKADARKRP